MIYASSLRYCFWLLCLLSFAEDKKSPSAACFQTCQAVSSDALKVPDRCAFNTACQLNGFMFSCWEVDESPPEQLGGIDFSSTFCLNLTVTSWLRVERVLSIIFKCVAKPLDRRSVIYVAELHQGGLKSVAFRCMWWWRFVSRFELMSWLQTGEGGGEVAWNMQRTTHHHHCKPRST